MQMDQHNDRELVSLAMTDNQQAFSLLMLRHKDSLNSYIVHQFSVAEASEDLLLIIFDKAFRNLHRYDPRYAFTTWLYTIADNTCIDYKRRKSALARAFHQVYLKNDPHYPENIPAFSDPESELIASQEAALVLHYINQLKPVYRDAARLRFLHEYAYEEIARELSVPIGTAKIRIHRAKEILSKWISNL